MPRGKLELLAEDVHYLRLRYANVFFIRSGREWALVDTAFPGFEDQIQEAARFLYGRRPPSALLLTHGHFDHSGGSKELARRWQLPVHVHEDELPYVDGTLPYPPFERPDPPAGGLMRLFVASNMPALVRDYLEARLVATETLGGLAAGFDHREGVPGLPDWVAIPTPGHSPGHCAYYRPADGVLLSGDALLTVDADSIAALILDRPELSRPPSPATADWAEARRSVVRMARLEPRALGPGHGPVMDHDGLAEDLRKFARRFAGVDRRDAHPVDDHLEVA